MSPTPDHPHRSDGPDVATESMHYSHLPSRLSFLVDQSRAAANAEILITAVRVELDGLPAGRVRSSTSLVRA